MDITSTQIRVQAFCLILASLLLVAATFFWNGAEVGVAGGTLQVYSCIFWASGLLGLLALVRPAMPRFSAWWGPVAIMASIGGNNWGMDGIFFETYRSLGAGVTHDALYTALGPTAVLTLMLPGLLFPVTLIATGIALYRTKSVPSWCAVLLVVGAVAFPASRIPRIELIAHAADLLIAIPCIRIAQLMLRGETAPDVQPAIAAAHGG